MSDIDRFSFSINPSHDEDGCCLYKDDSGDLMLYADHVAKISRMEVAAVARENAIVSQLMIYRNRTMTDGYPCFCDRWPNNTESGHQDYCVLTLTTLRSLGYEVAK